MANNQLRSTGLPGEASVGAPKQQNVGDSRSEHFNDAADRAEDQDADRLMNGSAQVPEVDPIVGATRTGLKAAREYPRSSAADFSDISAHGDR